MSMTDFLKAEHMVCNSKIVHLKQKIAKVDNKTTDAFDKVSEYYMQIEFYKGRRSVIIQTLGMLEKQQFTESRR